MAAAQRHDDGNTRNAATVVAHTIRPRATIRARLRTIRARQATIRPWARAHIGLLTIVIAAIGLVLYLVLSGGGSGGSGEPTTIAPSTSAAANAPAWPGRGSDAGKDTPPAQKQQVEAVARGFAADFATPGSGQQDWWTRVTRWTSPYLSGQLAHTDWNRVSLAQLTRLHTTASGPTIVDVAATYDTGLEIGIRIERTEQGWRVTTVVPMRTAY